MHPKPALLLALVFLASPLLHTEASAQPLAGFQLNRYEPTAAGEWSLMVDHPWYSRTRYFAGGLTFNYAHRTFVLGREANGLIVGAQPIIEHQLIGHVDLAGSFLDRVLLTASLPVILMERGQGAGGVEPLTGAAVGDPRFGVSVRLFGQPYHGPISMSLGANVWVPLRRTLAGLSAQTSDQQVRFAPRLFLGGLARTFFWSFTTSFLYRAESVLGNFMTPQGSSAGSELQFGLAMGYGNLARRLAIVPEVGFGTVVLGGTPFSVDSSSIEVMLGIHYNIASLIQLSVGGGVGLLRQPGTPDGRALLRLAYAPVRQPPKDRDGDGVPDKLDQCPDTHKGDHPDPQRLGCPLTDRDGDGVFDHEDKCPDTPMGPTPDPARKGCPLGDRDGDGVLDKDDLCPDVPMGERPDPKRRGCPEQDRDGDGVYDSEDKCPDTPMGPRPDPARKGCPIGDRDGDGVLDDEDQCIDVPQGPVPDPARKGCPAGDRDGDGILDPVDACPDKPGAPHPDPAKHGCPSLVKMEGGRIQILNPVFFATDKDIILEKSFPVLIAVADAIKGSPQVKKVRIEGHTDSKGKVARNMDLSDRRAKSVLRYLVAQGVEAGRLEPQGYGPTRPIQTNKTAKGRAANRRVDFVIIDPPYEGPKVDPSQIVSPDDSEDDSGKGRKKRKGGKRKKKQ